MNSPVEVPYDARGRPHELGTENSDDESRPRGQNHERRAERGPDGDRGSTPGGEGNEPTAETDGVAADLSRHLERIWDEVKKISRQVEHETQRSSRIARLRLDIRRLQREISETTSELGQVIYDAQKAGGKRPTLSRVEGYDALVETVDGIKARIAEKQAEIEELKDEGVEPLGDDTPDESDGSTAG